MQFRILFLLITLCVSISCNDKPYSPDGLTKVSNEGITDWMMNNNFPAETDPVYKNQEGAIIPTDSIRKVPDLVTDYAMDFYVNKENQIKEIIVRKATAEDIRFKEQLQMAVKEKFQQPEKEIEQVHIDCDKQVEILNNVLTVDQEMRQGGNNIDPEIDRKNLQKVINLIDQCGMPSIEEVGKEQMQAIWLVFQHADAANRKKYFPQLQQAAANGGIEKSQMAMMQDRILMDENEPQIYGTQVLKDQHSEEWKLYELMDPSTVDQRRRKVNLGPLKEYLSRWNINFEVKQKK